MIFHAGRHGHRSVAPCPLQRDSSSSAREDYNLGRVRPHQRTASGTSGRRRPRHRTGHRRRCNRCRWTYVEQILLRLRRAGIVDSTRGARGGYVLARPATEITVRDVVAASELQTFDMHCTSNPLDELRCADSTSCSIRPVWALLQAKIDEVLDGIRLADLLANEQTVRVRVKLDAPPELAGRILPVMSAG
ncbi:MAG: Rrf2 family transcriptional regulator [Gemmatimonadaceae bacterium]|nr:Rrf2 family transcriptional regulator [Gemmatimonadaceae bacterium]